VAAAAKARTVARASVATPTGRDRARWGTRARVGSKGDGGQGSGHARMPQTAGSPRRAELGASITLCGAYSILCGCAALPTDPFGYNQNCSKWGTQRLTALWKSARRALTDWLADWLTRAHTVPQNRCAG